VSLWNRNFITSSTNDSVLNLNLNLKSQTLNFKLLPILPTNRLPVCLDQTADVAPAAARVPADLLAAAETHARAMTAL
jgi:hypothetical protein